MKQMRQIKQTKQGKEIKKCKKSKKEYLTAGIFLLVFVLALTQLNHKAYANCEGHFVNPISDICWDCMFPFSIGSFNIVSSEYPDTKNPSLPIEICVGGGSMVPRVGLNIGFWEPFALTDVTPTPYCMVNLGGFKMDIGNTGHGGKQFRDPVHSGSFYYVHWYKYPITALLNIIVSLGCMQGGDFDIAYLTELDPMWNDDELAFILNPEAILFGNPLSQAACAADAAKSQVDLPIDSLFWCAGTQGSMYPFSGRVRDDKGAIQTAVLLSERMDFKLHRMLLIEDSIGDSGSGLNGPICKQHFRPIMPKSRYRYQLTNPIAAADKCYQFGHDVILWEGGHKNPAGGNAFGLIIFRKKSCCFI